MQPSKCDCGDETKFLERVQDRSRARLDVNDGPQMSAEFIAQIWRDHANELPVYQNPDIKGINYQYDAMYWYYATQMESVLGSLALEVHYPSDTIREPHVWVPRDKIAEAESLLKAAGYTIK